MADYEKTVCNIWNLYHNLGDQLTKWVYAFSSGNNAEQSILFAEISRLAGAIKNVADSNIILNNNGPQERAY